ncbi:RluA family pseudouridine synthase [Chloroflexota bacterium]
MNMSKTIELRAETSGIRMDVFVASALGISRSYAQKLITNGHVLINGITTKASFNLEIGDFITGTMPDPEPLTILPEKIPLTIVYEDSNILVIDKPAGLTVHPAPGNWEHTLVNALLAYCPDLAGIGGKIRPGIVHRLDKNTSGVMVVAKNDVAQHSLSSQIKERQVKKVYLALVVGHLSPRQGAIEAQIGRDPQNRKKMAVVTGGRDARTDYEVINYLGRYTYLEAVPKTGRTHQIRVHFAAIGYPVFADSVYGEKSDFLSRHFLHAHLLGFHIPVGGKYVEFKVDLPEDLQSVLSRISA